MKKLNLFAALIICCLSLSCSKEVSVNEERPRQAPPALFPDLGFTVSNQFGLKMYGVIQQKNAEKNICVSPFSIRTALSLVANGTAGEDQKEILRALDLSDNDLLTLNEEYLNLSNYLIQADPKITFETANSFWYQNGIKIKTLFRNDLNDYYHAEVFPVDFSSPSTLTLMNNWVSDKTHGKIKEIIKVIPPNTVMNLTNAIYFNGEWTYKFDRKQTKPWYFDKIDRTQVLMTAMRNNQAYRYYEHPSWFGLEMPYGDGTWAMYAFMPHQKVCLDKLTNWLIGNWNQIRTQFKPDKPILVYFPEFKIENDFKLETLLPMLGINRVFEPGANFSRMMNEPCFISTIIHKTYIDVNEDGTEAAGVTSAWAMTGSPSGLFFDHPFTYVIAERNTGLILFVGQVMDPTSD